MPAYNAEKTLEKTYNEIPLDIVDDIVVVDDASTDNTVKVAAHLNLCVIAHPYNKGYGANQKTCYTEALKRGADIVIMLHPDYQYSPKLIGAMASLIALGQFDLVLGSRIIGGTAIKGGMPLYKLLFNRTLTLFQNIALGQKLSEYHTGYRAFTKRLLERLPFSKNSDDFIFDNEMLCQALFHNYRVGEISCPTKYFREASSISFKRSIVYGLGVLKTSIKYYLTKKGLKSFAMFN